MTAPMPAARKEARRRFRNAALCAAFGALSAMSFIVSGENYQGISDPPASSASYLWCALALCFALLYHAVYHQRKLRPAPGERGVRPALRRGERLRRVAVQLRQLGGAEKPADAGAGMPAGAGAISAHAGRVYMASRLDEEKPRFAVRAYICAYIYAYRRSPDEDALV